jgi:ADP-ribose pyrophosphatase YjhB (NUDIX family)
MEMTFLKLGVATAVMNTQREILLSKRGDMGMWNLPTGRLDKGEFLNVAALREVKEETGILAEEVRPVGLYFQQGRERLNILYEAHPIGGTLTQNTDESTANTYFSYANLPKNFFGDFMAQNIFEGGVHLHVLETPVEVLNRVKRQLAWRYVKNLLRGKPEPRWTKFDIQASLIVMDTNSQTILSILHNNEQRILPGLVVHGRIAPWEQLRDYVREKYDVYELRQSTLRWTGLYQNKRRNSLEFVFYTEVHLNSKPSAHHSRWIETDSEEWWQAYKPFVQHIAFNRTDVKQVFED